MDLVTFTADPNKYLEELARAPMTISAARITFDPNDYADVLKRDTNADAFTISAARMALDAPLPPAYLFLDAYTTGINRYNDQIWSVSWALEVDGRAVADRDFTVKHTAPPSPWVLEKTAYARIMADAATVKHGRHHVVRALMDDIAAVRPHEVYLVGSNPTIDDFFLQKMTWGVSGAALAYHCHLISIENLVMGALGLTTPPTLDECGMLLDLPPLSVRAVRSARLERMMVRELFFALERRGIECAA